MEEEELITIEFPEGLDWDDLCLGNETKILRYRADPKTIFTGALNSIFEGISGLKSDPIKLYLNETLAIIFFETREARDAAKHIIVPNATLWEEASWLVAKIRFDKRVKELKGKGETYYGLRALLSLIDTKKKDELGDIKTEEQFRTKLEELSGIRLVDLHVTIRFILKNFTEETVRFMSSSPEVITRLFRMPRLRRPSPSQEKAWNGFFEGPHPILDILPLSHKARGERIFPIELEGIEKATDNETEEFVKNLVGSIEGDVIQISRNKMKKTREATKRVRVWLRRREDKTEEDLLLAINEKKASGDISIKKSLQNGKKRKHLDADLNPISTQTPKKDDPSLEIRPDNLKCALITQYPNDRVIKAHHVFNSWAHPINDKDKNSEKTKVEDKTLNGSVDLDEEQKDKDIES